MTHWSSWEQKEKREERGLLGEDEEEREEEEAVAPDVGMWWCDEVSTAYDVSCSHSFFPHPVYSPLSTVPDVNAGAVPRTVPPLEMQTSVGEGCWGRVMERGWGGARIGEVGRERGGGGYG